MVLVLPPLGGFHDKMHTRTPENHNSVICLAIPRRLTQYYPDRCRRGERLRDGNDHFDER
jgi:hypothetical protein